MSQMFLHLSGCVGRCTDGATQQGAAWGGFLCRALLSMCSFRAGDKALQLRSPSTTPCSCPGGQTASAKGGPWHEGQAPALMRTGDPPLAERSMRLAATLLNPGGCQLPDTLCVTGSINSGASCSALTQVLQKPSLSTCRPLSMVGMCHTGVGGMAAGPA